MFRNFMPRFSFLRSPWKRTLLPWQQNENGNHIRYASNLYKRMKKEDAREANVVDIRGANKTERAKRVYVWGNTGTGALGVPNFVVPKNIKNLVSTRNRPMKLKYFDDEDLEVKAAACGYGFSLFIAKTNSGENRLYGCGINTDSQLGHRSGHARKRREDGPLKDLDYIVEPTLIDLPVKDVDLKIQHIACGRAHSIIVTDRGTFSLGNNSYGQCGRTVVEGEVYRRSDVINRVPVPDNIKQVVCGSDHTIFLTDDGELYACGLGADGQTGQGHYDVTDRPERMRGDVSGKRVVQVSCITDTVLAVAEDGQVYGCGNSEYDQLSSAIDELQCNEMRALPLASVGHVTKVAAGGTGCLVLNQNGDVYVWGYGILGKGPEVDQSSAPQKLPDPLFGKHEFSQDTKVVDINAGIGQFCALNNQGELYTWGRNNNGILGLGLKKERNQFFPLKCNVPASVDKVAVGVDHMIVMCRAFV